MRSIFLLPLMYCVSFAQDVGRNTISVGAGGEFPTGGSEQYRTSGIPNSAAFSAAYEFRLFKYFAPEVGMTESLPRIQEDYKYQPPPVRERVTLFSFGGRGILPLHDGRMELFAGAAAVHVSSSYYLLSDGYNSPGWLMQINGGGRFAIDKRRHFWVGPTVRFSRDGGRPTEEWVSLTGDFGFRF